MDLVPQMPAGDGAIKLAQAAEEIKDSVKSGVIANLFLNLLLQNSLQSIWGMVNSLQILLHLPAINVSLPANAATLFNSVIHVVNIDVIPEDLLFYMYFWVYGTEDSPIKKNDGRRLLKSRGGFSSAGGD